MEEERKREREKTTRQGAEKKKEVVTYHSHDKNPMLDAIFVY